jgi:ABC-type antimicrobial peptide transport system permease subunit
LVLLSSIIATPIAWYYLKSWLTNYDYRITIGWEVFALAAGVALIITLLTVSFQAIKAAIANPVKSLRTE